jgi:hypothetical protein
MNSVENPSTVGLHNYHFFRVVFGYRIQLCMSTFSYFQSLGTLASLLF